MSKRIRMTPELRESCIEDFIKALDLTKMSDGKIDFTKSFKCDDDRKATLYFTEKAWFKMTALVQEFSSEVAWHGLAYRGTNEDEDIYCISDILVYPQEVTGSTVNTDQARYEMWLMSHEDDVFNNIRMQGHSHVNMGVTPSTVDLTHQGKILDQLEDDMFYIFMIWNKRHERNIKIYDMKKNVLFENTDISVALLTGEIGLAKFLEDAKREVIPKVYNPPKTAAQTPSKPAIPAAPAKPTTPTAPAKDAVPAPVAGKVAGTSPALPPVKDKAKQPQYGAGWAGANACSAFDDEDDDDYSAYEYYKNYHNFR